MNDNEKLKNIIRKNLDVAASDETYAQMRDTVLAAHEPINRANSATTPIFARRFIMGKQMIRLAMAAAIIAAVVLGLFEFIDTGSTSGVVWAEVARKVETCSGVIFRLKETGLNPNKDWPIGYTIVSRSPTLSRTDWYRGDQLRRTVFIDWQARTSIWLAHDVKAYSEKTLNDEATRTPKEKWTDPQELVNLVLSLEYQEIGRKMIDGVLCEGIETTDPNGWDGNAPIQSLWARVWVSVESGYPVLLEGEVTGGKNGNLHLTSTLDRFQWNVDFGANGIKPQIPADYECID